MTIAICDDSVIDCLLSKFLISEYFKKHRKTCDIVTYETGAKLISDFEDGAVFDIVFMDIYDLNPRDLDKKTICSANFFHFVEMEYDLLN